MHNSLPSLYRPDNRLDCPFPLAMIALSVRYNLLSFARDREYLKERYMMARFMRDQFREKIAKQYPSGAPEPVLPATWKNWETAGLVMSILHEITCDQKHAARVLFADAMQAAADQQGVSSRFDVFLVWHARVNSNAPVAQEDARAYGILDIEQEIISGLIHGQTDVAGNIAFVIAGAIEDLEREEKEEVTA